MMRNSREEAEYLNLRWEEALLLSEVFGLEPETGQTWPGGGRSTSDSFARCLKPKKRSKCRMNACYPTSLPCVLARSHTLIEMAKRSSVSQSVNRESRLHSVHSQLT